MRLFMIILALAFMSFIPMEALACEWSSSSATQKQQLIEQFHQAALKGQIDKVKAYLQCGIDIESKDNLGETALNHALLGRQIETMELLMSQGAKMSVKDATQWLVFIHSNYDKRNAFYPERRLELARLFLKWGADPNYQKHNFREPPLFKAVKYYDIELVRLLLDKGARVNVQDRRGATALYYAVRYSNKAPKIELLLSRGADANIRDDVGLTAIAHAVHFGSYESVKALVEFRRCFFFPAVDLNLVYKGKYRLLDMAREPRRRALLLKHGAKPGPDFIKKDR